MNILSLFPIIISSICIYTGLGFLLLFFLQKEDRANLTFAALSIIVGIYDIFCFGLYNSGSLAEGIVWQRLQLSFTNLIGIFILWFCYNYVKKASTKLFLSLTVIYTVLFILGISLYNDFTLSLSKPSIKEFYIFRCKITYYEAIPGIIYQISMVLQAFNFLYVIIILTKEFLKHGNKSLKPIIFAVSIFFIAAINDYLVSNRIYSFVYLVEYSYLIMVLSMSILLLQKFVRMKEYLLTQLYTDDLTSLPNRKKLMIDIEKRRKPYIFLVNIDSFKEINDYYGNEIGDFVLLEMVNRLKEFSLGFNCGVYKMHGDEYAILIEDDSSVNHIDRSGIESIVHFLFEKINDSAFMYGNKEIHVRVTIGVANYLSVDDNGRKNKVINNADMVLKEAKKTKKSFLVYTESTEINKEYESNIFWEGKLKKAIRDNLLIPFYQPIVDNMTGKIEKYECLIRMIDDDGNIISPYKFLDISQKTRLYNHITEIIFDRSFEIFKNNGYGFSINLSVKDILNHETNRLIRTKLEANRDIAGRLVFEILESEGVKNIDVMTEFINNVKSMGCKLAIDDFGSGYSNFDYIIKMKVDYIKIDSSIIKNLNTDRNSYIIAKMIVNASKELGLKTIAEFVHSKDVFEKCLELGIDYSQGYYFGEPKRTIDV